MSVVLTKACLTIFPCFLRFFSFVLFHVLKRLFIFFAIVVIVIDIMSISVRGIYISGSILWIFYSLN